MIKMVKLFGFDLNDTSGVLLFIFAIFLLLGGGYMLYIAIHIYNQTSQVPAVYTLVGIILTLFALYILMKTLQQRNK
jgi:Kef-type K+ transport system membrane component KefB